MSKGASVEQKTKTNKKKGTGMLGFLTLKEPSASAWEDFAEAQKRAAAQKGGRSSAVGMPGVSSQKLPNFVPKTNSKWDGLPDNAKSQSADMKAKDRTNRNSTMSFSTACSGLSSPSRGSGDQSPARKFGSLSSRPQSSLVPPSKRGSLQSSVCSDVPKRGSYRAPAPTAIHPALRDHAVTPWDEPPEPECHAEDKLARSPQTFLHPPSPLPLLPELSTSLPTPDFELPEPLRPRDYAAPLCMVTNFKAPPQAPPIDSIEEPTIELCLPGREADRSAGVEQHGTFWHSDTDNEDSAVRAVRLGALKASVNFSRPRGMSSGHQTTDDELQIEPTIDEEDEESDSLQPTLRDDTGRTSPFVFEHGSMHSRHVSNTSRATASTALARSCSKSSRFTSITATTATTVAPPLRSPTFSDLPSESTRPSTAASTDTTATACRRTSLSPNRSDSDAGSVAPSELSMRWTMSPKERLGLGGKVTRRATADALPWEKEGSPAVPSEVAAKRQSWLSQNAQEAGKLKRLSAKLGRK